MPIAGFPVLTARAAPGLRARALPRMQRFAHMAGLLVLLHDQSAGSVRPGSSPARPRIRYTLDEHDRRQLAEGLVHCCEVLLAGGAREVLVPYWQDPLVVRPGDDLAPILRRGVRAADEHPDRVDAPAVDLPDGRRPADVGRQRVRRVARGRAASSSRT